MPSYNINETFNINVSHIEPGPTPTPVDPSLPVPKTGAPDTGFFNSVSDFLGNMNPTGWFFVSVTVLLIIAGVVFFLLQRKFHRKTYTFASIFLLAVAVGFAIPAIHSVSTALSTHTTNLDVTVDTIAAPAIAQIGDLTLEGDAPYGYAVYAYLDTNMEDNALYGKDGNKINSIATDMVSPDLFEDNTYGIKSLITDNYVPLSTDSDNPTLISNTDEPAVAGDLLRPITYAAKLNDQTPADTYTGKIVYVVVPVLTTLAHLEAEGATMQDARMADACVNTPIGNTQYQFKDARDNKMYYVAKLKDGRCWMTQNLDLDITTAGLTNELTDLNSVAAWNQDSQYKPKNTETTISTSTSFTDTRSWDFGDYYYDGVTSQSCGSSKTSYADCVGRGFETTGNQHYHIGNLYQWNTATAGSGGTILNKQAPDSICPKGWRLPTGNGGEFKALVQAYGSSASTFINDPIYMVRSGYLHDGGIGLISNFGHYWSSTARTVETEAYSLNMAGSMVSPDFSTSERDWGTPVRCIAR